MDEQARILAGRYEVGDVIGRGGMAEVHIGHDRRLGRTVAIKILRSDLARDPSFQNRFRREAQAAAALNHPSIVAVYDTGEETFTEPTGVTGHVPFIVMEYVEGHTVRDIQRDGRAMPIDEAYDIAIGVLSALEYSHHAGIVHRDIKPANVMITPTGAVKVMDFGIARAVADAAGAMTQTQAVLGTAQYLSPEQARGEQVDARSDLYSTGCLLFEMLTGRPPFMADSPVAVAYQHVREEPPLPSSLRPGLNEALDRVVLKALAKDREARYQSAAEFRADLEAARTGGRVLAPVIAGATPALPAADATQVLLPTSSTSVLPPATPPWQSTGAAALPAEEDEPKSRRWLVATLLVVAVLAVVGIVYLLLSGSGESGTATVPDVTNQTEEAARALIEGEGLVYSRQEEPSADIAPGSATRSDPAAGESVAEGSTVTVFISTGPASLQVPDVSGQTASQAVAALEAVGLVVDQNREDDNNPNFDQGQVTRTEPPAQTPANEGDTVKLFVSTGNVDLPSLVGLTQAEATAKLTELNLNVTIAPVTTAEQAPGTVVAQDRTGLVPQRTPITLQVATAPTTAAVPTAIIGQSYDEAVATLATAGFGTPRRTDLAPGQSDQPAGTVTSSNPAPGTTVSLTTTVTLTVSGGPAAGPTPTPTAAGATAG